MINVLLECLRFAYTFLEVVLNYISKPSHLINSFFYGATNQVSNVPNHLAVLYTDKCAISLEALSRLIVHCARAGVRKITLYDPWSCILAKKEILRQITRDFNLKNCSKEVFTIVFYDSDDITQPNATHTAVKVLGAKDGRQSMVRACRKLCMKYEPTDITVDLISECLAEEHIYEPDFLLQIGSLETMAGYPPWVLRITEILRLKRLPRTFSYQQLLSYLHHFSLRERRFGQ